MQHFITDTISFL